MQKTGTANVAGKEKGESCGQDGQISLQPLTLWKKMRRFAKGQHAEASALSSFGISMAPAFPHKSSRVEEERSDSTIRLLLQRQLKLICRQL